MRSHACPRDLCSIGQKHFSRILTAVRLGCQTEPPPGPWPPQQTGRLLRVWSRLEATYEQMDWAALPSDGVPVLQRQVQASTANLNGRYPVAGCRTPQILPSGNAAPGAGALRIEYAVLLSWSAA